MSALDKLINIITSEDIVDSLDEEQRQKIVDDVLIGYKVDEDSMEPWLETNREAMRIIKHCENDEGGDDLDIPMYKEAKVIYPLLAPAVIHLASRMIQHVVRNDRVAECKVLGKDEQIVEPSSLKKVQELLQSGQIQPQQAQSMVKYVGRKEERAKRVSDYMNYELLFKSRSWLKDAHKLCHVVASWGTGFKRVYYDPVSRKNNTDLLSPEDVVINHNISCLEKAKRVTTKHYLTVNEIIEQIRGGFFTNLDEEELKGQSESNQYENSDVSSEEIDPASLVICQFTNLDLDEDGYAEPYKVYVHKEKNILLGIYPAFEETDIRADEDGKIIKIDRRLDVVDYHLIDDPEGKFYSIGLNYLLIHSNKSITSLLRQLIDAGSLSNAASCTGFITNAFRPRERHLEFKLGEWKKIEIGDPSINPQQHIIPLPAKDPSQVLMGLLEMLINSGEKTGFITDVLTGDIAGQNVPATTMLAIVEQGTRAIKPVIQKWWMSTRQELKLWFHLNSLYLDEEQYALFNDSVVEVTREDFNEDDMDIIPVADPTQSSEAHKYAKLQFILQMFQAQVPGMNVKENLTELYRGMEFDTPERFVAQPSPPPPDPRMEKVKVDAMKVQKNHEVDLLKVENEGLRIQIEKFKALLKGKEVDIQIDESDERQRKMLADAAKGFKEASVKERLANVAEQQARNEEERIELLKIQARKDNNE